MRLSTVFNNCGKLFLNRCAESVDNMWFENIVSVENTMFSVFSIGGKFKWFQTHFHSEIRHPFNTSCYDNAGLFRISDLLETCVEKNSVWPAWKFRLLSTRRFSLYKLNNRIPAHITWSSFRNEKRHPFRTGVFSFWLSKFSMGEMSPVK